MKRWAGKVRRMAAFRLDPWLDRIPVLGSFLLWLHRNDLEAQRERKRLLGSRYLPLDNEFMRGYHGSWAEFILIVLGIGLGFLLAYFRLAPKWLLELW